MSFFEVLDLSSYEIKVYRALVRLGKCSVSEINRESAVPKNRIYDVLESLIHKKLAYLVPEMPKKYVAEDPEVLKKIIEKKKDQLNEVDIFCDNLKKEYVQVEKQKVIVSHTGRNFKQIIKSLPEGDEFNYSIRPFLKTTPLFIDREKERIKNNVKSIILYDKKLEGSPDFKKWNKINSSMKPISTNGVIISCNEKGVVISLSPPENESLIIYIENKNLSLVCKQLIDAYYCNN